MKTLQYVILFLAIFSFKNRLVAQCAQSQSFAYLQGNDTKAIFRNGGSFFWDGVSQPTYEVGGTTGQLGASSIFAGGLWLEGFDAGNNLLMACQTYNYSGNDFWAGPLDNNSSQPIDCIGYDRIWKVSGTTVRAFLIDFNDNGVIDNPIDNSILAWPARGNSNSPTLNNLTLPNQDLAPFFDRNGDDIYNPYDGDYPIADPLHPSVIADDLMWMVFNDNGNTHTETGGLPIKAEVHLTAYAFTCSQDPLINKTIFVRYKIINKNQLDLYNVRVGVWTDFDLGCVADDYIGSIPALNTVYAYNADNDDQSSCFTNAIGYGVNPPVQALTLLNQTMSNSMYYINNGGSDPKGDPAVAVGYHHLLNSAWANSVPLTYGGDGYDINNPNRTNYAFPDNPNDASGWSMFSENLVFDLRALAVMTQPLLPAFSSIELTTAYSYHRDLDSNHLQNVNLMYQQIPMLQSFYDNGYDNGACTYILPIRTIDNSTADFVRIYPNPAQSILTIESQESNLKSIELFNTLGQSVYQISNINQSTTQLSIENLPKGIYLIKVQSGAKSWTQKIELI